MWTYHGYTISSHMSRRAKETSMETSLSNYKFDELFFQVLNGNLLPGIRTHPRFY